VRGVARTESEISEAGGGVRLATATGRWIVTAAVLGTGVAFLDSTVVNAALPAIAKDLGAELTSLQWVLTAYLLTLGSLLVLGGSLGDLFGRRRMFVIGLAGFAGTSLLCGAAPNSGLLIVARLLQGVAAAMLVPGSLAMISASFHPDDRARAIGAWSGLGGIATAAGPFLGGWLIDSVSWRLVFFINLPLSAAAIVIALRHVPETRDDDAPRRVDVPGALSLTLALAGAVYALIEAPAHGLAGLPAIAAIVAVISAVTFVVAELRSSHPMVPLSIFRSRQFAGANVVTLFVYAALGATTFLLVVHLQQDLGYSALEAGASLLPITALMLAFSARSAGLAQRLGPRPQMTIGPLVIGVGLFLMGRISPGDSYLTSVLPAVAVLGCGLTLTVAPLTAAVLAAIDVHHAGVGSAINNAVARIAGLLAVAVIPAAAGITALGADLSDHFDVALNITATLSVIGAIVAFATIRRVVPVETVSRATFHEPCDHPCVRTPEAAAVTAS
jgi:EmrB/QacA subfamily drug resistance transporter